MDRDRILKRARLAQQRGRVGESIKGRILADELHTMRFVGEWVEHC